LHISLSLTLGTLRADWQHRLLLLLLLLLGTEHWRPLLRGGRRQRLRRLKEVRLLLLLRHTLGLGLRVKALGRG
jgi:hypothetical protein